MKQDKIKDGFHYFLLSEIFKQFSTIPTNTALYCERQLSCSR